MLLAHQNSTPRLKTRFNPIDISGQGFMEQTSRKMSKFFPVLLFLCFVFFETAVAQCCPGKATQNCTARDNFIRRSSGRVIGNKLNTLTVGPDGPTLIQDIVLIEEIAHFDRERIPPRPVHAKGNGAFGYFEVTDDITRFTKANVFSQVGKRTPIAVRFSPAASDLGTADTNRNYFGFSIKFYTEEGNWDLVGVNIPVFPIREPSLFPSLVRTFRGSPANNIRDTSRLWDFNSLRPETMAALIVVYSDSGNPLSYRNIDGSAINVFKFVNARGEVVYTRFVYKTDQGVRSLPRDDAKKLAGTDPDAFGKDLYEAINNGNYPSWTLCIQIMTMEQSRNLPFNPFDPTKEWPESVSPLIRVGKIVLDRNPSNHFAEIEQLAVSPANLVPGIEPSQDKLLQGRLSAHAQATRYRLGINYHQIPVNCPFRSPARNYQRDGKGVFTDNGGDSPNYFPNSYGGPMEIPSARHSPFEVCGVADKYDSANEDNFSQPRIYYQRMDDGERERLARNIAESLSTADLFVQQRQLGNFRQVHPQLEAQVRSFLENIEGFSG